MAWAYAHPTFPYSHWRAQREQPSCPAGLSMQTPRRKLQPIKVYCSTEERRLIERQADVAGVSASEYLRTIGLNFPLKSRVDQQAVKEMLKTRADMARAGGLLKMILKNEERLLGYTGEQIKQKTVDMLDKIEVNMTKLNYICEYILRNDT